jgi:AcrR family transcriptional regulator
MTEEITAMTGALTMDDALGCAVSPAQESAKSRKVGSRERLRAAATELFCAGGYFPVSVEDIAAAAGVSRMTFYRHFNDKAALAAELFRINAQAATPRWLGIGQRDFHDPKVVAGWIAELSEADRADRQLLRVFIQANADKSDFTEQGQAWIGELIAGLGVAIPAFALDPDDSGDRRRWFEAWLLLYEILDQGNHVARGAGVFDDPLVVEILADRFVTFIESQ